jgi:Baseplate J-like protein
MTLPCGCCQGIEILNPLRTANRPGLDKLAYRVGTYGSFFETMLARLSSQDFTVSLATETQIPVAGGAPTDTVPGTDTPLSLLKTRAKNDPAIALLDAWAMIADVLTFYQERIANEGYLRTATERRSVLELAHLVGYSLRPGVAASVFLAYTLDQDCEATIPIGSRAQNLPAQGELPQSFETSAPLFARDAWNNLTPRLTQPQMITLDSTEVYVEGTNANLKPNDPLLVIASPGKLRRVANIDVDFQKSRTKVTLQDGPPPPPDLADPKSSFVNVVNLVSPRAPLIQAPAEHPASSAHLPRSVSKTFTPRADMTPALLKAFHPEVGQDLYTALENARVTVAPAAQVHAFRVQAAPFGNNAPLKPITDDKGIVVGTEEWPLEDGSVIDIVFPPGIGLVAETEAFLMRSKTSKAGRISIKLGLQSGSASFSASAPSQQVTVGPWKVRIIQKGEGAQRETTFEIEELRRKFVIRFAEQLAEVRVDARPPISVPLGETVTFAGVESQTLVTYDQAVHIHDETALAPTQLNVMFLDSVYDQIVNGSWAVIERPDWKEAKVAKVTDVQKVSVTKYGMSARVTQLTFDQSWLDPAQDRSLAVARNTTISAQSEQLALAEEPISDPVSGSEIELGALYSDLQSGRWLIVKGERTDIPNTSGVTGAELVMLGGVKQGVKQAPANAATASSVPVDPANTGALAATQDLPGDSTHSFLQLANPLSYKYKRETVTIYGNVVNATHGESRSEVLGGGDSSQELQQFTLHQAPVTFVAAPTPEGTASTLQVRVNDLLWHEVDTLADATPTERCYVTQTDDDDKKTIIFGDGVHGMRLPTGMENVKAAYRSGIGSGGNVAATKISLLATRPLGVRSVINPLPATGGADRDTRDQARRNVPIASAALDRLVSVQDYADFARTFAGIGKANATHISDGKRQVVFVTVAGAEDIPIGDDSDLKKSLVQAFQQFGDPYLPLEVEDRELMVLVISAKLKVLPDYLFESVAPKVRAGLLEQFGFDRQELGQSVPLSQIISAIQAVEGVAYVDVDVLESISEADTTDPDRLAAKLKAIAHARAPKQRIDVRLAELPSGSDSISPAQLAYLNPKLPDTLILTEITS